MKNLVHYLLKNHLNIPIEDWTVQGFGFLRLRVDDNTRVHVWDSRLRVPGVSDIHDHSQWAFRSHVISGAIVNIRYQEHPNFGVPYQMMTINCGIGGGPQTDTVKSVDLMACSPPELYVAGMSYQQEPDEIHRTLPADGTVTLLEQERRDTDTARVFWPKGGEWGNAVPRQARVDDLIDVVGYALTVFNP